MEEATGNLRRSSHPLFRRLRELVLGKGVDPNQAALAGIQIDELYAHGGGELTLPNGDHIVFSLNWPRGEIEKAELTQWFKCNDAPARSTGRSWLAQENQHSGC